MRAMPKNWCSSDLEKLSRRAPNSQHRKELTWETSPTTITGLFRMVLLCKSVRPVRRPSSKRLSSQGLASRLCLTVGAGKEEGRNFCSLVLEAKVREAWANFKHKNKAGAATDLADGFRELEEDNGGFGDRKAEPAMVDAFELRPHALKDFRVTPIGKDAALVNYLGHYQGKADGQPVNSNTGYGEVWIRQGTTWKLLYVQETNLK